MKLKEYQERALKEVKRFLEELAVRRSQAWDGKEWLFDFAEKAWEKSGLRMYLKKKDGLERPLPVFCLKIPTGGGKTLLAVKTVDLVQTLYRRQQTGLVVWIVPTLQIYRQTLLALRDRDHPYRQHLDMASAGRTLIVEKTDGFTPQDVEEHLVVLMLMLPSASRANKEALRMFRDSGAFHSFFPPEEDKDGHAALLRRVPNLETFEKEDAIWGRQIKTSLGNTIRLLEPLIILDERHKARTPQQQDTLRNLNPCMIVELSATPPREANNLVVIGGADLHKEEMIRLDLHVMNKSSNNWHDTMRAAMQRRDELEEAARSYAANTNVSIRPMCLVQVERTGREQRDGTHIHAEEVREYLIGQGVAKDWIAVKSAEVDELKDFDDVGGLLSPDCPIRYVITKHALQEGWDCAFAYVLAILTNPRSKTALTQLVGRILRQPYARKTGVLALDESYVYCYQRNKLMDEIRAGFLREGLGDMQGRITTESEDEPAAMVEVSPRSTFKKAAANIVLPAFVIRDGKDWRLVSYEADILSRVRWAEADVDSVKDLDLSLEEKRDLEIRAGLEPDKMEFMRRAEEVRGAAGPPRFDFARAASHLLDIVPNPWIGYDFVERVFSALLKKWKGQEHVVASNLVFVLEELRKRLETERDRLAESVFNELLEADDMRFMVVTRDLRMNRLPKKIMVPKTSEWATRKDSSPFQLSLFDRMPAEDFNELEREVATFLDEQSRLYFWFRNTPGRNYYVQGWQKSRIYADFLFASRDGDARDFHKVFVLETKGLHLRNEDTAYKQSVFALCNKHAKRRTWKQLVPAMRDKDITYEVVFQEEWEKRLNELLAE
ncbi:MAG: DEAD/DEAH box helicase family protein [Planctomycetes bacterium]|nr:DEAD/DEAH box helicase family protein [Planctomycetota bacterium]